MHEHPGSFKDYTLRTLCLSVCVSVCPRNSRPIQPESLWQALAGVKTFKALAFSQFSHFPVFSFKKFHLHFICICAVAIACSWRKFYSHREKEGSRQIRAGFNNIINNNVNTKNRLQRSKLIWLMLLLPNLVEPFSLFYGQELQSLH